MGFYTINDLQKRLYNYPCNSKKEGWVSYTKNRLTQLIQNDYARKKDWFTRKVWNDEEPAVWGVAGSEPYPKDVEEFAKTVKGQAGGKKLIVMNEAYFDNCYFGIEGKFLAHGKSIYKTDTKKEIIDIIMDSVNQKDGQLLSGQIQEILNRHLNSLNAEIQSLNNLRKSRYNELTLRTNVLYYKYIAQRVYLSAELSEELKTNKEILLKPVKLLRYPKLGKLIEEDIKRIQEDHWTSADGLAHNLADRIQKREKENIKKLKKIKEQNHIEMISVYNFESKIKDSIRNQVESKQELSMNTLLTEWLRMWKLI